MYSLKALLILGGLSSMAAAGVANSLTFYDKSACTGNVMNQSPWEGSKDVRNVELTAQGFGAMSVRIDTDTRPGIHVDFYSGHNATSLVTGSVVQSCVGFTSPIESAKILAVEQNHKRSEIAWEPKALKKPSSDTPVHLERRVGSGSEQIGDFVCQWSASSGTCSANNGDMGDAMHGVEDDIQQNPDLGSAPALTASEDIVDDYGRIGTLEVDYRFDLQANPDEQYEMTSTMDTEFMRLYQGSGAGIAAITMYLFLNNVRVATGQYQVHD